MVAVEVEQVGAALAKLLRAAADSATNSIESAAASMNNGVSQLAASEGSQQECSPNTNADSNQHPASSSCCHVAIGASFWTPKLFFKLFFKMCVFPHAFSFDFDRSLFSRPMPAQYSLKNS
jgi:hypothetical protein